MEGEHKENLGLWCYNTTKTINTKNYSVSDSQRKQELGDVCIQCLRVSKGSVIFFLQIWKIQWGFFFFFFNPRDSNPICHPSFCHIPLPWTYNYGWHSPRGGKKWPLWICINQEWLCFTFRWVICIVKTVITFFGGRKVLVAKYIILLGKKSHTSHF